jgi:hypothetical protein
MPQILLVLIFLRRKVPGQTGTRMSESPPDATAVLIWKRQASDKMLPTNWRGEWFYWKWIWLTWCTIQKLGEWQTSLWIKFRWLMVLGVITCLKILSVRCQCRCRPFGCMILHFRALPLSN